MEKQNNEISMYWWEGFRGFKKLFIRIMHGKSPYARNFGDLLSPVIVSLLVKKNIRHTISEQKLLALGSIFFALRDKDLVWGSGFLNAKHIKFALACRDVKYCAVRGPETRRLLLQNNITCPEVYGDPAILLPQFIKNDIEKKNLIGIVPHLSHHEYFQKNINQDGVMIINVEDSLAKVVRNILSCEIILSTSLHGLIIAEAYGIPSLLLVHEKPLHGDLFKFEDYFHSTNRSLAFAKFQLDKINNFANMAAKQNKPFFNTDKLLQAFPFEMKSNLIELKWSNLHMKNYKHSIIPPRLSVP